MSVDRDVCTVRGTEAVHERSPLRRPLSEEAAAEVVFIIAVLNNRFFDQAASKAQVSYEIRILVLQLIPALL